MKKITVVTIITLAIILFLLSSCVSNETESKEIKSNTIKDTIIDKKEIPFNVEYISNYFIKTKSIYGHKQNIEEELEFLDYNIAFFKYKVDSIPLSINSLFKKLYIKAFNPSDSVYFLEKCAPKMITKNELKILTYGDVTLYNFLYNSTSACQNTTPSLILNLKKKEIILIESNGIIVDKKGKFISVFFNTRGNISTYKIYFKNNSFVML